MKVLILSTHPTILKWKTLAKKLEAYNTTYNSGKNAHFSLITVQPVQSVPKIVAGRIDHDWLHNHNKPFYELGYDIIKFHGSLKQKAEWGIKPSLRGANPNSTRDQEDNWFFADEHTLRKGLNAFEQVGLHEDAHSYYDHSGKEDITHTYHDANKDIKSLFKTFDWSIYKPLQKKEIRRLQGIVASLVALLKPKPVTLKDDLLPLVKRQADKVLVDMELLGHSVRIVQGYRSIEEQNRLYAQGRTTPGQIVTKAKGGESYHNYGVAVDYVFRKEGYGASKELWNTLGAIIERHGFEWGGSPHWIRAGFVDMPHAEMKLGYTLSDFKKGLVDLNKYK